MLEMDHGASDRAGTFHEFKFKTFLVVVLIGYITLSLPVHGSPINRQAGINENVYITVQNDTYGIEQRVCSIDSMTYEDGESIPTSSLCEHCVCRPPGFACTIISCEYRPGCKALKRSDQCCPEYQCECEKNGKIYQNGEKILDDNNPCEVCYCQGGDVICAIIDCYWRSDCQPRYIENRCCPLYDHCPPPSVHGPMRPTHRPTTMSTTTFSSPMFWLNMSSAIYATPTTPRKPVVSTTITTPISVQQEVDSNDVAAAIDSGAAGTSTSTVQQLDNFGDLDNDKSSGNLLDSQQSAPATDSSGATSEAISKPAVDSESEFQDTADPEVPKIPEVAETSTPLSQENVVTEVELAQASSQNPVVAIAEIIPVQATSDEESIENAVSAESPRPVAVVEPIASTLPPAIVLLEGTVPGNTVEPQSTSRPEGSDAATVAQNQSEKPKEPVISIESVVEVMETSTSSPPVIQNDAVETTPAALIDEVEPIISDGVTPDEIPLVVDELEPIISEAIVQDEVTSESPAMSDKIPIESLNSETTVTPATDAETDSKVQHDMSPVTQNSNSDSASPTDPLPTLTPSSEIEPFPVGSITIIPTGSYSSSEYLMSTVVTTPEESSSVQPHEIIPSTTVIVSVPTLLVVSEDIPQEQSSSNDNDQQQPNADPAVTATPAVDTELDATVAPHEVSTDHGPVFLPAPVPENIPGHSKETNTEVSIPSIELEPPKSEVGEPEPPKVNTSFDDLPVFLVPPKENPESSEDTNQPNPSYAELAVSDDFSVTTTPEPMATDVPAVQNVLPAEHVPVVIVDLDTGMTEKPDEIQIATEVQADGISNENQDLDTFVVEATTLRAPAEISMGSGMSEVLSENEVKPESQSVSTEAVVAIESLAGLHDEVSEQNPENGGNAVNTEPVTNPPSTVALAQPIASAEESVVFDEKVNDLLDQLDETTQNPVSDVSYSEVVKVPEEAETSSPIIDELVRNMTSDNIEIDPIPNDHEFHGQQGDTAQDVTETTTGGKVASTQHDTTESPNEEKFRLDLSIFSDESTDLKTQPDTTVTEMAATESQVIFDTIHPESHLPESLTELRNIPVQTDVPDVVTAPETTDAEVVHDEVTTVLPSLLLQRHHLPGHLTDSDAEGPTTIPADHLNIPADHVTDVPAEVKVPTNMPTASTGSPPIIQNDLIKKVDPISDDLESVLGNGDLRSDADNEVSSVDSTWYWRTYDRVRSLFPSSPEKSSRKPRSVSDPVEAKAKYWGFPRLLFW